MPKKAPELGPLQVQNLTRPRLHAVGGVAGLLLQVQESGARSWILRIWIGPKRRNIGLGGYPDVTLAEARDKTRQMRAAVAEGRDPLAERQAARAALRNALSFSDAMEAFLDVKLTEFDNEKHRRQWRATLDRYARPVLGDLDVGTIEVGDVLRVIEPHWSTKTEIMSRLRGRIEMVLAWATAKGHRTGDNPARWRGNLDAILSKPGRVVKVQHHGAVQLADAPDWFGDLRGRDGMATRALEFLALTATRSGEVRGARWVEMDLDTGLWVIPASRMKSGKEHRVPLTDEALALLAELPRVSDLVFPAVRGGQLSDMALSAAMRRINEARHGGYLDPASKRPAVPHGLRSTFRDWCAERGVDRDLAEISLAQAVGSEVERAYRRSDMLERRRVLMAEWGDFLRGATGAKVVELRR